MLHWADARQCDACGRVTPRTKRGVCTLCATRTRGRNRKAKAALIRGGAAPLIKYGLLLKVADNLWSVWLRAYWPACEMCQRPQPPTAMQCAHGFSRQSRAIRFDESNTFALCAACHRRHTPAGPDWWEWMRTRIAQRRYAAAAVHSRPRALLALQAAGADPLAAYARVELAARARRGKLTTFALHGVIADVRQRIEALPEGERKDWARGRQAQESARIASVGVQHSRAGQRRVKEGV